MDYNEYRLRLAEIQNRYKSRMQRAQFIADTMSSIGKTWATAIPAIEHESIQRRQQELNQRMLEQNSYASAARMAHDAAQLRLQQKTQALNQAMRDQQMRLQSLNAYGNNVLAAYAPRVSAYLAQIKENPFAALSLYQIYDHLTHDPSIVDATGANPSLYNLVMQLSDYLPQLKVHDMRLPEFVQGLNANTPEALETLKKIFMAAPVSDWEAIHSTFVQLGYGNAAGEVYRGLVDSGVANVGEHAGLALREKLGEVFNVPKGFAADGRMEAARHLAEHLFRNSFRDYLNVREPSLADRYREALAKMYGGTVSGSPNTVLEMADSSIKDARVSPSGAIYGGGAYQVSRAVDALNRAMDAVDEPANKEVLERMRDMLESGGLSLHTFAELANQIKPEVMMRNGKNIDEYALVSKPELRDAMLNVLAVFPTDVVDGYKARGKRLIVLWRSRLADYTQGLDFRDVVETLNGRPEIRDIFSAAAGIYSAVPAEDRSDWIERVYEQKYVPGFPSMKSLTRYEPQGVTGWTMFGHPFEQPQQDFSLVGQGKALPKSVVLPNLGLPSPEKPVVTFKNRNFTVRFTDPRNIPQEVAAFLTQALNYPMEDRAKTLKALLQELQRIIRISERDPTILPANLRLSARDAYRKAVTELLERGVQALDNPSLSTSDGITAAQGVLQAAMKQMYGVNVRIDGLSENTESGASNTTYEQLLREYTP